MLQKNRIRDAAYRYQYALKKLPIAGRENTADCVGIDVYAELQVNMMLNLSRCKRKLNVIIFLFHVNCILKNINTDLISISLTVCCQKYQFLRNRVLSINCYSQQ